MTALCGMAQNVTMLAGARIGVGIGESASTPASQSIIADLFDKDERPRALGIFAIGTYLGVFLGYFFGGWVNQYFGWRMAFIGAGLPGIAIAILLRFTVAEPARRGDGDTKIGNEAIGPTFAFLLSQKSFLLVLIGFCLAGFTNYSTAVWTPPFMARVHHLTSAEIGTYAGTFKGPVRDRRRAARRLRGREDRQGRRSLEAVGAGNHVRPRRPRSSCSAC